MMHAHTIRLFDDPTKRIDRRELEAYVRRSRRTNVIAVVPPPDDFDTRKTTPHRALFPPPPMRPVYPVKHDPLPLFYIFVLLTTCCAVASLIAYG